MKTVVFLGPSLALEKAREILDAVYLPPVRRGDVRAAMDDHQPDQIVIIDGVFEQSPSVWHKEILWALANRVPVWGASSMGALRAAELAQFGMTGHGVIFESYLTGRLDGMDEPFEDDDEVAVVHGPAEIGYPASEAMVDMRLTLLAAEAAGVIDRKTRDRATTTAKRLFYKDRSWPRLIAELGGVESRSLDSWLPSGRLSQKENDAKDVLKRIASGDAPDSIPPFPFQRSLIWEIAEAERGA